MVDLLMVSHVDDDHIQGILELTGELKTAQMEKRPQLVKVLALAQQLRQHHRQHAPRN